MNIISYFLVSSVVAVQSAGGSGGSAPSSGNGSSSSGGAGGSPTPPTDCTTHKITNILPCDPSGSGSVWNLLAAIVNFLAIGVGVAVLVGIVFGAFLYASSGGSAEQAKRGTTYVRNAVIALVLFAFMWALINFFIPGGLL